MISGQSKVQSWLETCANTAIGYIVALLSQIAVFPLFGIHVPFRSNIGIGLWFTLISIIRSFVLRRAFNTIHVRQQYSSPIVTTNTHPAYDGTPATAWALNPWMPMSDPLDIKHMGKLGEELGEASSAVARCLIQGIAGEEPVSRKINKVWLEDELADVRANSDLVAAHFNLDEVRMAERTERKKAHLRAWHQMIVQP